VRIATINSFPSSDEGTFGKFLLDDGWSCFSGELPWRDNQPGHSSIPRPAVYTAYWGWSEKHQAYCYHLRDVPGRSAIEIHAANFCGDKLLGKKCDLLGCIALGMGLGELSGQAAILSSKVAIVEFHQRMKQAPLQLVILPIQKP
jgi:hypothetical protein